MQCTFLLSVSDARQPHLNETRPPKVIPQTPLLTQDMSSDIQRAWVMYVSVGQASTILIRQFDRTFG